MNIPDEVIKGRDDLLEELRRASGRNETWAWNVWNLIGTSRWRAAHDAKVRREALREAAEAIEGNTNPAGQYGSLEHGSRSQWFSHGLSEASRRVRLLAEGEPGPVCVTCGRPSTYRLGMPEPSWCDEHGPKPTTERTPE